MLALGRLFTAGAVVTNSTVGEPRLLWTGVRLWKYHRAPAAPPASTTRAANAISRRRTGPRIVERAVGAPSVEAARRRRPRPRKPRVQAVRAEAAQHEDNADAQDPLRLRHLEQLEAAEGEHAGEAEPEHVVGNAYGELARDQDSRDGADQQPRHRVQVDVAANQVTEACYPQQRGGVEDVRADDLRNRQREDEHHHEPEERAAADGRQTDDEAEHGAHGRGDRLVAGLKEEWRVARLDAALDERLRDQAKPAEHERHADGVALRLLRPVPERACNGNSGE